MRNKKKSIVALFAFLSFISSHAVAQETFNIWPGAAPESESWKQEEQTVKNTPVGTVVINVLTPTVTAYLPAKSKATGTAVIIAPGGACIALAMKSTDELATRLSEKGIAAFILKYRLKEKKEQGIPKDLNEDTACQYGIADAVQSIKFVRKHAREWGISKIGILGFSAGGMICKRNRGSERYCRPSRFCGPYLWCSFCINAGNSLKAAPHFYVLGTG